MALLPEPKVIITCELVEFENLKAHGPAYVHSYRGHIKRTSGHPRLGAPNGKITVTSEIVRIDFVNKLFETLNTIYQYK